MQDMVNYLIVFDLDGTLVDTDKANSKAYQQSVYEVTKITINTNDCRLTRDLVQSRIKANNTIMMEIISRKEKLFSEYLKYTTPLPALFILQHLTNTHNILLTQARRKRAEIVLDYYGVTSCFDNLYCKDSYLGKSKFDYLVNEQHYSPSQIILFENEQKTISEAVSFGIPKNNIYKS